MKILNEMEFPYTIKMNIISRAGGQITYWCGVYNSIDDKQWDEAVGKTAAAALKGAVKAYKKRYVIPLAESAKV